MASARKEKRASLSALDPPLSPIAEEGALRKDSVFKRFFSTRTQKKKMIRSLTLDTEILDRSEKQVRPRNLSFDLPSDDSSDPGVNSASSSSASSTCSDQSYGRTISSDGGGLLEPISTQTKALSCQSFNSNGNTDESDGSFRHRMAEDGLSRDPRTVSKHKYFSPNGDRNFISKYLTPTFHDRSRSFNKLFQAIVPEDEQMLASFSCAYQREILVQGRIFISSRHFCFYANIFGWGTIFAIPMIDVTDIKKEKTLLMFPNSIQLNTEARGNFFFASFTNRDKTLKVMRHAWEQIQAGKKALTPDQLWELMNPAASAEEKEEKRREKEKEKQEKEKEKTKEKPEKRSSKRKNASVSISSADETAMLKSSSSPNLDPAERAAAGACTAGLDDIDAAERSSSSSTTTDISMSECICDDHMGKKLLDEIFPKTPAELHELLFSASPWHAQLSSYLKHTAYAKMPQRYTDYHASDWATNKDGVRRRTCTYTLALNQAMAPSSCTVTEQQVYNSFPGGFTILKESRNKGVPYADHFHITCTYCVMSYGHGQARLVVYGGLVWTKSVWGMIKGYIDRSTVDGLADHYNTLRAALNEECKRSAAGSDGLALGDDQNRMDTSSEEGVEADKDQVGNQRGMAGSISGINFVHNAARIHEELTFDLPLLGRVRRIDFYGIGIMALLSLVSVILMVLMTRLSFFSTPDSRLAEAFERYLGPDSAHRPPTDSTRPDLDTLIAAIGRIGEQLQQVRDNAHRGEL